MPSVQISDKEENGWSFIDAKETKREKKRRKKDEESTRLLNRVKFEPTLGKQPSPSPEPEDKVPKAEEKKAIHDEMAKAAEEEAKAETGAKVKQDEDGKGREDARRATTGRECRPM